MFWRITLTPITRSTWIRTKDCSLLQSTSFFQLPFPLVKAGILISVMYNPIWSLHVKPWSAKNYVTCIVIKYTIKNDKQCIQLATWQKVVYKVRQLNDIFVLNSKCTLGNICFLCGVIPIRNLVFKLLNTCAIASESASLQVLLCSQWYSGALRHVQQRKIIRLKVMAVVDIR